MLENIGSNKKAVFSGSAFFHADQSDADMQFLPISVADSIEILVPTIGSQKGGIMA